MILESVISTASSLGGYWHIYIYQNFLTRMSFTYCSVALAKPFCAARRYASPELKAFKASWEKQASRRTVRRRLWFMALSTSELVADSLSASSDGGASGACLVLPSASGPGLGVWLVEAQLATSPDIVRRGLFVLKIARMLIYPGGVIHQGKREGTPYLCSGTSDRTTFLFAPWGPAAPRRLAAAGSVSPL